MRRLGIEIEKFKREILSDSVFVLRSVAWNLRKEEGCEQWMEEFERVAGRKEMLMRLL